MNSDNKEFSSQLLNKNISETDNVTYNELSFILQIINECSKRGAFKPDEFSDIGTVYNKFKNLVYNKCTVETKSK